ncbi:hypothetical protein ACOT81_22635 [Streptomyces sp. WI04-05B]|uniref:hypothetical protein n=1 Tax=Streptomyces TaxID=1883 RepID=UPI0029BDBBAD|nr:MULTISPECIES: hypothetical protein [unclassified Streptomyces]MDX2543134.1 hypothetical protein [Streptomyces sp. WI04-05B]MDX2584825.1 hypothetical protein [Streptomyces sp. WI04-05A]MDX3752083.1 hypothetical protein [Streptomyces sp. AK08-02]
MRRTAVVAGVVTVLAPFLLTGASSASAATKGSLTVRTLDRSGRAVYAQVAVYNTKTLDFRYIESNKAASLPNGSYELATSFTDAQDDGAAVGGHSVKVSGATKTTFDARTGHQVKVALSPNPGSGYDHMVSAYVCAADNGPVYMGLSAESGHLYVIPTTDKAYELSYATTYEPRSATGGDFWLASATHRGGLPSGVSATIRKTGLTTLKVTARSGPDSGQAQFSFDNQSTGGDACPMFTNSIQLQRTLPDSFGVHLPPGQWNVSQEGHDSISNSYHAYAAGKTTTLNIGHAVWGPGGQLPYTWYHQLYFGSVNQFADPSLPYGGALAAGNLKLTHAGRTLYSRNYTSGNDIGAQLRIPSTGWYTLDETGRRSLPAGSLSTSASLSLHFYADTGKNQQIRDYITRFWPNSLNSRNQAPAGATTTVVLGMQRNPTGDGTVGRLSDDVKSVHAWYTTDNGAHWHASPAKLSNGRWTVPVHNPPSGGRVGLRSTVTDTHGDSSTTTVYNAYAVR